MIPRSRHDLGQRDQLHHHNLDFSSAFLNVQCNFKDRCAIQKLRQGERDRGLHMNTDHFDIDRLVCTRQRIQRLVDNRVDNGDFGQANSTGARIWLLSKPRVGSSLGVGAGG